MILDCRLEVLPNSAFVYNPCLRNETLKLIVVIVLALKLLLASGLFVFHQFDFNVQLQPLEKMMKN